MSGSHMGVVSVQPAGLPKVAFGLVMDPVPSKGPGEPLRKWFSQLFQLIYFGRSFSCPVALDLPVARFYETATLDQRESNSQSISVP